MNMFKKIVFGILGLIIILLRVCWDKFSDYGVAFLTIVGLSKISWPVVIFCLAFAGAWKMLMEAINIIESRPKAVEE